MNNHTAVAHGSPPGVQEGRRRAPKVDRPVLSDSLSEENWTAFLKSWNMFVEANHISNADQLVQLFACCDLDLRSKVTSTNDDFNNCTVAEMLELLHSLSVLPVAIVVQRSELLRMFQQPGESIRSFYSRV